MRSRLPRATRSLLLALVLAVGCSSTKGQAEECEETSDCAEGARCVDVANGKACTGPLSRDAFLTECGEGGANGCAGLRCLVLEENLEGKAGICSAPCAGDAECPNGACLAFEDQKLCFAACSTDDDCANGFACVDNGDGRSVCLVHTGKHLAPCTDDAHCQDGTAKCVDAGEVAGMRCTGDLADPDAFETECTAPEECLGLVCVELVANEQDKTGICSARCRADADCPKGRCVSGSIGDFCYSSCTSDDDCSNGFVCIPAEAGSDELVCAVTPK